MKEFIFIAGKTYQATGRDAVGREIYSPVFFKPGQAGTGGNGVERERDLHDEISLHCLELGYLVCHSRMDRASTIAVGWPDFCVFMPDRKVVFLECKARGKKATTSQIAKLAHARKLGFVAEIVDNLDAAKEAIWRAMND